MKMYRGFTLLEVLVAMSIFSVIGLGAYQMLRTIIETHEATQNSNKETSSLIRAVTVMDRDFSQIVARQVRDEYGEPLEPLMVGRGEYYIEITRTGWNNPAKRQRSILQRVAYQLSDGTLSRHFWLVLDRAEDSDPVEQDLIDGVESFQVSLLNEDGDGTDVWPDSRSDTTMSLAIEIVLKTKTHGDIRRVFVLPSGALSFKAGVAGENPGDGGGEDGEENTDKSSRESEDSPDE